jgi:hypothetical protein
MKKVKVKFKKVKTGFLADMTKMSDKAVGPARSITNKPTRSKQKCMSRIIVVLSAVTPPEILGLFETAPSNVIALVAQPNETIAATLARNNVVVAPEDSLFELQVDTGTPPVGKEITLSLKTVQARLVQIQTDLGAANIPNALANLKFLVTDIVDSQPSKVTLTDEPTVPPGTARLSRVRR